MSFQPSAKRPARPPGATIYRLREQNGLSYRALAKRIERRGKGTLDPAAIHRIEHGSAWTSSSLALLADAFGVQTEDLFLPPYLAPVLAIPEPERERILRKVADYCADLGAAYTPEPSRRAG